MKEIKFIDEVHCQANSEARKAIKFALSYKSEFWRRGEYAMEQEIKTSYLISGRNGSSGHFLTGLLPRINRYCRRRNIDIYIEIGDKREKIEPSRKPTLTGIKFRKDQLQALKRIARRQRGKIIAPTGSGKTIVMLGAVSMFPDQKTIILAHTKDLIVQLQEESQKYADTLPPVYFPTGSKEVKDSIKKIHKEKRGLLVCTIQSISRIEPKHYVYVFDITQIDECHRVNSLRSQYGNFMLHNLSPRRYGYTATDLKVREKLLVNEGLIGPRIARLSVKKAIDLGIVAKPIVKMINIPYDPAMNKKTNFRYNKYYEFGIVENKSRNNAIKNIVIDSIEGEEPVLVIVEKIKHGQILQEMIQKRGINIPFVYGDSGKAERSNHKKDLISGDTFAVIASRIWMEGINIPNLRTIVYAAGTKEEKKVLQTMGRGLRSTQDKDKILLYDFLDPYRYLAEHAIKRIQVYNEEGWI